MKNLNELRGMGIDDLNAELLLLRRQQFNMRLKRANGVLEQTHEIPKVRRSIAQVKTIITEKAGGSDGK